MQGAFDEVVKEFGRVDAVVASAGMLAMITVLSFQVVTFYIGIVENYTAFEYVRPISLPYTH